MNPLLKFSDSPADEFVQSNPDGSRFIPIQYLELMLDNYQWNTKNFHYQIFKNGYADLGVAASIELEINYLSTDGAFISRTFVGACSFSLTSLEPNTHFLATAKSECVKNAASDIGIYFGRGLNKDIAPVQVKRNNTVLKSRPDIKIMKQFEEAVKKGDEATVILLSNIYDIKTEKDAEEK